MRNKPPFYGLFKWLSLIVFISVGHFAYLPNTNLLNILNVRKPFPSHPMRISAYQQSYEKFNLTNDYIHLYWIICIIGIMFWLIALFVSISLARKMRFVKFSTNLNIMPTRCKSSTDWTYPLILLIILLLFVFLFDPYFIVFVATEVPTNLLYIKQIFSFLYCIIKITYDIMSSFIGLMLRLISNLPILIFKVFIQIFVLSYSVPTSHKITTKSNIFEITFFACSLFQYYPIWLTLTKIILSNDIETNPGDLSNGFFTFCNWNINSLAKDDFYRINLIEALNSTCNYDIISLCETSLNNTVTLPDVMLENYTFIPRNNPLNTKHGGVGVFYKNTLPVKVRNDLSFDETIVLELKFGRKKMFFTVLYRSPAHNSGSPQFDNFLLNFRNLYETIKNENPYTMFFTGDFNGHSRFWWNKGDTNPEGRGIE